MKAASLSIDEHIAAADKSITTASKHRIYGVVPKTLVNVARAVKAGRANIEKLVDITLEAVSSLTNVDLLKIGADLANLCAIGLEHGSQDANEVIYAVLKKVGRQDNDLIVFALQNKDEVLGHLPQMMREVSFDLVKYYFKS